MSRCTTLAAISGAITGLAGAATMPIDMTGLYTSNGAGLWATQNAYQQWSSGASSLVGNQTLGGVDFALAANFSAGTNTFWNASNGATVPGSAGNPATHRILNIPVGPSGVHGVDKVYTLMNVSWGLANQSFAKIEFIGTNGAHHEVAIVNGVHVRNWLNRTSGPFSGYATTTSSPDTQNVWTGRGESGMIAPNELSFVDMQTWDLPSAFDNETLLSIKISDWGANNYSNTLLLGASLGLFDAPVIPLPQTAPMALAGLALLATRRRR